MNAEEDREESFSDEARNELILKSIELHCSLPDNPLMELMIERLRNPKERQRSKPVSQRGKIELPIKKLREIVRVAMISAYINGYRTGLENEGQILSAAQWSMIDSALETGLDDVIDAAYKEDKRGRKKNSLAPITLKILEKWDETRNIEKTARATFALRDGSMSYSRHREIVNKAVTKNRPVAGVRTRRTKS